MILLTCSCIIGGETFRWLDHWYPIHVLDAIDPSRPHYAQLLGAVPMPSALSDIPQEVQPGPALFRRSPAVLLRPGPVGRDLVLWRDGQGQWNCMEVRGCAHHARAMSASPCRAPSTPTWRSPCPAPSPLQFRRTSVPTGWPRSPRAAWRQTGSCSVPTMAGGLTAPGSAPTCHR